MGLVMGWLGIGEERRDRGLSGGSCGGVSE